MDVKTQHGYLVLADISGFTSYLAGVELDHASGILSDLLETIVGRFKTLLTIAKLEGDAVFAFAPEAKVPPQARTEIHGPSRSRRIPGSAGARVYCSSLTSSIQSADWPSSAS